MGKYYIANIEGHSGIDQYARDFFTLVLKGMGYEVIAPTHVGNLQPGDEIHIEVGLNQHAEVDALFGLLRRGFRNVSVTMHDPPQLKYPLFRFRNGFLNNVAKFVHLRFDNFGFGRKWYGKIQRIFVLNQKAREVLMEHHGLTNVYYIPHILNPVGLEPPVPVKSGDPALENFIFFGFIDRRKGIEYALKLHEAFMQERPASRFFLVGGTLGPKAERLYRALQATYRKNVEYLGFLGEERLGEIFSNAASVILPFKDYGFIYPTNGSVLSAQRRGKVVFSTRVNAIAEMIDDGRTGFFLSGELESDLRMLRDVLFDTELVNSIRRQEYETLARVNAPENVKTLWLNAIDGVKR